MTKPKTEKGVAQRDQAVLEDFREKFRCPVCIGVTMDSECQPVDCGECNGSTFNPDWDYKSAESFLLQKLQEERAIAFKEGAQSRCVHGMWLKDKVHDGEKCRGCGSIIKSK